MKRSEFWNRLFNSGGNGISIFVGTALIAVIAIVITACPGATDATTAKPKYTVSYNVNEGEGTPDPATQTVNDGETIANAPTGISKPGFTLNTAWNTKADGTGDYFLFGDGGTPVTADITLYAQWADQQHTVTYNVNEGEGTPDPPTQKVNHNDLITAAPTGISRPDYTLNAVWNTKADGTGESFKFGNGGTPVTADIILYAQWIKQYTVSYNVNEGEGTPDPATQTVNHGETIAAAPTGISRTGYTLSTAWNTKADGTGDYFIFGDEGTPVTADITLYAQWADQQHTVNYDVNEGEGTPDPATQEVNHNDIIVTAPTGISRTGYALKAAWNTKADGSGDSFKFGVGGTPVTLDITLYAQWTRQYTVSYDINEGDSTAPAAETVEDGGTVTKPADPTRSDHLFTGWFDAQSGGNEFNFGTAVTADITLYAQWTIMTYTVSYNFNRGDSTEPSTETVEHGGTAAEPTTDPTWTGYTFNGWFDAATGGDAFDFGTVVTTNIDLYAQWTIKQYTVSYNVNEGEGTPDPATQTVNHGETIAAAPTGISRTGYTLNTAWNTQADGNGDPFLFGDEGTPVTADITLYAQWADQQHTVNYHANEGDSTPVPATQTVNHNDVIATAPTVSRTGYALNAAWNTQANGQGTPFIFGTTQVTSDMDLYAQWTIQYTVSYHANEGDVTPNPATQAVTAGETIATAPTVSRNGYTLNAQWNTQADGNGDSFSFGSGGTPVTANMDLYAQWTIITYTVSYNFNRGDSTEPSTETVDHGGTAAEPTTDPTWTGYTFNGWFDAQSGGNEFNFGTAVTSDIILYAQWTIKQYTVSYNVNEGEGTPDPATQTVNHGETIAAAPTGISRPGYTLNTAWNTQTDGNGDSFQFGSGGTPVTEDITLYAQWTIKQYTVNYNVNEGEGIPNPATQTVNHGETIAAAPTGISKTGFTLSTAWNTKADGSGDAFLFGNGGTPVTADITLYAQWANQQYTVNYHANGGDGTPAPATQTVNDGDIIAAAPTVSRTGYTLNAAWNTAANGTGTSFLFGNGGTPVTADITLYAQWTIKQYTVTYDVNGGIGTPDPATQKVNHGETIASAPTGISRTYYYLHTRWNTKFDRTGTYFLFGDGGTPVTEDITLYALWSLGRYTVTYDANGGDGTPNPATQEVVDGDIIPEAPTGISKTGHTLNAVWNTKFDGSGNSFTFGIDGTPVTGGIKLYAQWTAITYTVTYNLNGGDSPAPAAETVDHDKTAPEPTDPTRSGYAFTGWSDAQSGGSEYIFGTRVTADIELYAQWIKQYTVSYDVNGGDSTTKPADETVNDGGTAIKPTTDPTRTGHTFVGWFDAQSGGNEFNFGSGGTAVTSDITLYARWATTTYTVSYDVNGGDSTAPANETVADGTTAAAPPRPTRSGHAFTGWFDAKTGGNEFNFGSGGTAVTSDITLYARWTQTFHTVTFDPNYGSETPTTQNVPDGGTAVSESPSRTGYTLANWYTDENGNTLFDFNTAITGDDTLYAQWEAKQYVVSLDENDGEQATPVTVTATYDALLPTNQALPTRSDSVENYDSVTVKTTSAPYVFKGYFASNDGDNPGTQYYDENMTPTTAWDQDSAATIYAHWAKPTYTVTLAIGAGSSGGTTTSVEATLGELLPLDNGILSPTSNDNALIFKGYTDFDTSDTAAPDDSQMYYIAGGTGNPVLNGGRTWNFTEDTTIHAVYRPEWYGHQIIIKDPNDVNHFGLTTMQADGSPSSPSLPTRPGFRIAGYTESSDGSGTVWEHPPQLHGNGNWDWSQSSRTIYVKWEQD